LLWGQRAVGHQISRWRAAANTIPDEPIRSDALQVLDHKRTHLYGAALFWTLPAERNLHLLRLLVAYEIIWDFLDNLSERAVAHGQTNGYQLHLAISEAVDPDASISGYYLKHPWHNDAGYLHSLVKTCQRQCRNLPSYPLVRDLTVREAQRAQVLAINHHPDPHTRDTRLQQWAASEYPNQPQTRWWELSGAASAPLAIHALLALAAEPHPHAAPELTYAAYTPLSATTTMLDSYVDQGQDHATNEHSYVSHYPDGAATIEGITQLVRRSLNGVSVLQHGNRHALIAAAMIAMYLSKSTTRTPQAQADTNEILRAAGPLAQLLLPVLKAWRLLNAQQHA
jgi:tetraprenyl-beta-curcumene synthase